MEIFSNDSDSEDTLSIASKEWNRIANTAKKTGYRDGVEDGSDSVFQEGFDQGYKEGFQHAFILGKFKSLLDSMPRDTKHPQNINEILDKVKRGACYLCLTEAEGKDCMQKPFSEIIEDQRTHSGKILQILYQYFQPHVAKINISEMDIVNIQNNDLENN